MRTISKVIVHHSASDFGDVDTVRRWHLERGFGDVGYHYLITNGHLEHKSEYDQAFDGAVFDGRPLAEIGAHALGHNEDSIGVCLIGNARCTRRQFVSLINLIMRLNAAFAFGIDGVLGHCEVDPVNKPLCPGFDMELLRGALTCARSVDT